MLWLKLKRPKKKEIKTFKNKLLCLTPDPNGGVTDGGGQRLDGGGGDNTRFATFLLAAFS